ncbi:S8 family peptidase [Haliangium sp.]|uniref:S8 family peptidase n=1 Tax=Haliangium sp. TaxID=2663208 RepID=UPI003D0DF58C
MAPASAELRILAMRDAMLSQLGEAEFVPGDVIVAYRTDLVVAKAARDLSEIQAAGATLQSVQPLALPGTHVYRAAGADRARTIAMIEELNQRPDVLYAQPNFIYHPLRVPNDEFVQFQWHYESINLPGAWDITVGDAGTVVAVVDTGILFDPNDSSRSHPDLAGKVLPGFDFISDTQISRDGDGRDGNPFDPGDTPGGQSSYHGSHVSGTIAAATDNQVGLAGVNWSARILPVRALGVGGGSSLDILDGIRWAAGLQVTGVPDNPTPADVINLSLGGTAQCSPFEQQIYDQVSAKGTIVVVAAGNENQNAANVSPASCSGVITVGATDFLDQRAPYSNFGARIDIMAPGGDMNASFANSDFPDGVLSLGLDDSNGEFVFNFLQGTSMAAPHVAGVVSLMKGLRPELTTAEAVSILRATSRPLSAIDCKRSSATDCGAGLIDAQAALQALLNGELPPPVGTGNLIVSPNPVDFGNDRDQLQLSVTNNSGAIANWTVDGFEIAAGNPGTLTDSTLFVPEGSQRGGVIEEGGTFNLTIALNRQLITVPGIYTIDLLIGLNGTPERVPVRFNTLSAGSGGPSGATIVAAVYETALGDVEIADSQVENFFFTNYRLVPPPGFYQIIAWTDDNGNGLIDNGDYIGSYPEEVQVLDGETSGGRDFDIAPVLDLNPGALGLDGGLARALESLSR